MKKNAAMDDDAFGGFDDERSELDVSEDNENLIQDLDDSDDSDEVMAKGKNLDGPKKRDNY